MQLQKKNRTTTSAQRNSCIFAQTGALEASCPDGYGPAAVWRSYAKDLPLEDRAGFMRRQGSIVEVDLVALTRRKEETSADVTMACQPVQGQKPHELIFVTDCYDETEREKFVTASESGR